MNEDIKNDILDMKKRGYTVEAIAFFHRVTVKTVETILNPVTKIKLADKKSSKVTTIK